MFSKKSLRIEVQLNEGEFKEGQSQILEFKNLPMDVVIRRIAFNGTNYSANIKIYGVTKEHLDTMTRIKWRDAFIPQKAIRVFADNGLGEKLLFEGNVASCNPYYQSPNAYIDIQANAGIYFSTKSGIPPSSLEGEVSAPDVFQKICDDYGITLVKPIEMIEGKMRNPYFDQNGLARRLKAASLALNVRTFLHNDRVEIKPLKAGYTSLKRWEMTPKNFIGYPKYTDIGIEVQLDEIADIDQGDIFTIKDSDVTGMNRDWLVISSVFNLSTRLGGKWFMTINGSIYVW